MGLFFYGNCLPILEGELHFVIVDQNLADEPFDILLVKALEWDGHSFKNFCAGPDVLSSLCFQGGLVKQGVFLIPELDDFIAESFYFIGTGFRKSSSC